MYYKFVRPEYERLRLARVLGRNHLRPKITPEEIRERVAARTREVHEACRRAMEELVETLPCDDARFEYLLTQLRDVGVLRRKLPRDEGAAVGIIVRLNLSTAEGLVRADEHFARAVCASPHALLRCEGDRSPLILTTLFDTPWKLHEDLSLLLGVSRAVDASDFAPRDFDRRLLQKVGESLTPRQLAALPTHLLGRVVGFHDVCVIDDEDVFMTMYEKLVGMGWQNYLFRITSLGERGLPVPAAPARLPEGAGRLLAGRGPVPRHGIVDRIVDALAPGALCARGHVPSHQNVGALPAGRGGDSSQPDVSRSRGICI